MNVERIEPRRWLVKVKGYEPKREFFVWCMDRNAYDEVTIQIDDDQPVTATAGVFLKEYVTQKLTDDRRLNADGH